MRDGRASAGHDEVPIRPRRHGDVVVAERPTDLVDVRALGEHVRRGPVPESVDRGAGVEVRSLARGLPVVGVERLIVDRRTEIGRASCRERV